jgi:molybdenum-dependent DNA-binding transcriptional regulator ModE
VRYSEALQIIKVVEAALENTAVGSRAGGNEDRALEAIDRRKKKLVELAEETELQSKILLEELKRLNVQDKKIVLICIS